MNKQVGGRVGSISFCVLSWGELLSAVVVRLQCNVVPAAQRHH